MGERKGDWIQVFSGLQFWPLDPRPEDIRLTDIAHALANLCRFGGHCRRFYSVAQHSTLAARYAPEGLRKTALLHDATEAYLVDVPRPIKRSLVGYKEIEENLARVIGERFDLDLVQLPRAVKEVDERLLFTEKRDLTGPAPAPWTIAQGVSCEPYPCTIVPLDSLAAEYQFLDVAKSLGL